MMNPSRKQAEIGFAAALIGAAAWVYVEAGNFPDQSAGYPRVLAVMLGVCALIIIVRSMVWPVVGDRLMQHPLRCFGGFVAVFLYIVGIDLFGYILPSIVFSISVPVLLGYRHWKVTIPVVLGMVTFIFVVFKIILERPLPPDVLAFLY